MKFNFKLLPLCLFVCLLCALPGLANPETDDVLMLDAGKLADGQAVDLEQAQWKYHAGDDPAWAAPGADETGWDQLTGPHLDPLNLPPSGWAGRAWFRLKFNLDESLAGRSLALVPVQKGAAEIYLDGALLARFGQINETAGETEDDPNHAPVIFKLDRPGEHTLAVRYSLSALTDVSQGRGRWLVTGGFRPGITLAVKDAGDPGAVIRRYAFESSMRSGFFFIGFLAALALLHFLLYIFYRAERANLYYSFFALSFMVNMIFGNLRTFGHYGALPIMVMSLLTIVSLALTFTMLPAFLLVAFGRPLGKFIKFLVIGWILSISLYFVFLNQYLVFKLLPNIMIAFCFGYSIYLLIEMLRKKQRGAWILLGGVIVLQLGMFSLLLSQFKLYTLPQDLSELSEIAIILGVPISVSIFLARNFARTNRDLKKQLAQVELLSLEKIEQERQSAELRAENERRAKELEEARALQISMLPRKLPQLPHLEIAAYMKPATEVGGDYYDFHVGHDGTLTVAVGDATGHGLKAGTVVTATKGLFNNLAAAPHIPDTLQQISRSLKGMNLRGLFMAMTMLKIKDDRFSIAAAGMPSTLLYRRATGHIEEISLRALPLGSIASVKYSEQEFALAAGDLIVLMSDGFPEMFNEAGEMLGSEEAEKILREAAALSPQEIIDRFISAGETWAAQRPPDDDVTFVVVKMTEAG